MNSALPILYVLDGAMAKTGAIVAARNAALALAGTANLVLVLPRGHQIAAMELQDFWRVETIPMAPLRKNIPSLLRYFPVLFVGAWALHRLMKRDNATRLMVNDFYLLHGVLLRLLGFRGQIVTWVRCDPARFAGPLAKPMLWLMQRASDKIIAVSQFIQRLLVPMASEVIYDAYTGTSRAPKSWAVSYPKIFVMVGNYIRGKGQDMALSAFMAAAAQDMTIQLHFYGSDMGLAKNRDYRAQLEYEAQQGAAAGRIRFHDAVADTSPILATAYAALNFSVSESFSMTVLEASGAGLPVIATMSGGPQEILVEGSTGYLIPVGDVAAAAARILQLAANPVASEAMGKAGAEFIVQHFTTAAYAHAMRALWQF